MKKRKYVNALMAYSTAGLQLAIILTLFVFGGYKLDVKYNTSPVFILLGSILGMGTGLYTLLRGLKEIDALLKKEKEGKKVDRRSKWM